LQCGKIWNEVVKAGNAFPQTEELSADAAAEFFVLDSLSEGTKFGFHVLQFNAVVKSNAGAIRLYQKLGFEQLGILPECYRNDDGTFEDIILFFHRL
jgi:hypothetical protein